MKPALAALTLATLLSSVSVALAHEFWIEPPEFQVQSDAEVVADLRNGEMFRGTAQSFLATRNTRLDAVMGARITPVTGRMGDRPALRLPATGADGLLILAHEAAPATVTYTAWDKFLTFAAHKDFPDAEATHIARGWTQDSFTERYTRHSKALIAVGSGAGADRALGLVTEFIAQGNPYAPGFVGPLEVSLLYQGAPRADAQIEVYARDDAGEVTVTLLRTDAQGLARIPVTAGMDYLLDAVVLREAEGAGSAEGAPLWETLWASLTFAVPAR